MRSGASRYRATLICLAALAACACAPGEPAASPEAQEAGAATASGAAVQPADAPAIDADRWHDIDDGVETRRLDVRFGGSGDDVQIWTGGCRRAGASARTSG